MANEQEISWHVVTHEHRERSADWYWALGLGTLAGAGLSIFFGNFMLAIILVVGAGSIGALAMRGPREHLVHIDSRGLSLDGTLYRWSGMQTFWVEVGRGEPRLFLTTHGFLTPRIAVPLDDQAHAQAVRQYLRRFLPEEEQGPHLGEHIAEIFGL